MKLLLACAACYGQSDSAMAAGMNWGIFSLLGMVVVVLGGVAGFFIYLARRSSALAPEPAVTSSPNLEATKLATHTTVLCENC
jgi:heme/copper-type cytochrome/quinol oxidase subunit 2